MGEYDLYSYIYIVAAVYFKVCITTPISSVLFHSSSLEAKQIAKC